MKCNIVSKRIKAGINFEPFREEFNQKFLKKPLLLFNDIKDSQKELESALKDTSLLS
jgi:hypothetical protein